MRTARECSFPQLEGVSWSPLDRLLIIKAFRKDKLIEEI